MITEQSVIATMATETRSVDQIAIAHQVGRRKVKPILDALLAADKIRIVSSGGRGPRWGLVDVDYPASRKYQTAIRDKSAPHHDELHQRFFAVM